MRKTIAINISAIFLGFSIGILSGCVIPQYPVAVQSPEPSSIFLQPTDPVATTLPYTATVPEEITDPKLIIGTPIAMPSVEVGFGLQPGSPKALSNFAHPEAGCSWMGVGGQIFDHQGKPLEGYVVKLTGFLGEKAINLVALTGGALYLGPGGYEFKLADKPFPSKNNFEIILYDKDGNQISEPVKFETYEECDKNFILINFIQFLQIQNGYKLFVPVIIKSIE